MEKPCLGGRLHELFFEFLLLWCTAWSCAVASGGGAEDMSRLLDTILQGHKPSVLPRLDQSGPVNVQIGMKVNAIVGLDTKTQVLNLRAILKVSWKDKTLHWSPDDYGNITSVILSQNALWMPDIALLNSLEENSYFLGGDGAKVKLGYDGQVDWAPAFNADFFCQTDVVKFPMDVNICVIKSGSWMQDDSLVHVEPMVGHIGLGPGVTNGQFRIEVGTADTTLNERDGLVHSDVSFILKLRRMPANMILSNLLPMFLIGALNVLSFVIPADNEGKVDLSLNIMLSTTMFLSVIHDDLPDRSDSIATVAVYVIALFVLSFLGVIGNTVVSLIHGSEQSQDHEQSRSLSASAGDISQEKQVDLFTCDQFFKTARRRRRSVSGEEEAGNPAIRCADQNQNESNTHLVRVESGSKAAKVNFACLVLSALCLFGCTLGAFMQII
ncbi:hypothetical protein RRG08_045753 [Elysia crispata]|uniref:Uncharacterized protein n=1 Tax=Elysia crispata TaxID=231223 RepID=A0AAE0ZA96_9GAST|nr:hypothetical protein RRG08_045753 [Elysia crispata]